MKTTAIILGTSRSNGNTALLAHEIQHRTNAKIFDISKYNISSFDYDFKNENDDYQELIKEVLTFDNLVFTTPVYWYSMSTQMKVFFDRINDLLTRDRELARKFRVKNAFILSTGADITVKKCFEEAFLHSFNYLGMDYKGMLYIPCDFDENPGNNGANITLVQFEEQISKYINTIKKD